MAISIAAAARRGQPLRGFDLFAARIAWLLARPSGIKVTSQLRVIRESVAREAGMAMMLQRNKPATTADTTSTSTSTSAQRRARGEVPSSFSEFPLGLTAADQQVAEDLAVRLREHAGIQPGLNQVLQGPAEQPRRLVGRGGKRPAALGQTPGGAFDTPAGSPGTGPGADSRTARRSPSTFAIAPSG